MKFYSNQVYIVLPFFYVGGVERWASFIAKGVSEYGLSIQIYSLGKIDAAPSYFGVDADVKKISFLNLTRLIFNGDRKVILTGLTKLNVLLAGLCFFASNTRLVTSVHLSISKKGDESYLKYNVRLILHRIFSIFSYRVVCVSKGIVSELNDIGVRRNVINIYNPCFNICDINPVRIGLYGDSGSIKFVSAGRLHSQKRFDRMLQAFNDSRSYLPHGSTLTIYGEGPLYDSLKLQIHNLELGEYVFLKGFSENLLKDLGRYNVFLLTSDYEGFGNVLAEALAVGLNCISMDIPHGPKEILDAGNFGVLTEDYTALVNSLKNIDKHDFPMLMTSDLHSHLEQFTSFNFTERFVNEILCC